MTLEGWLISAFRVYLKRSNFFFSPPAHLCAVTYMTEISLIVTLNSQFNSTQLNDLVRFRCKSDLFQLLVHIQVKYFEEAKQSVWEGIPFLSWYCRHCISFWMTLVIQQCPTYYNKRWNRRILNEINICCQYTLY